MRGAAAIASLALLAGAARADESDGWIRISGKDAVTDAVVEGAQFRTGGERLVIGCRERDGAKLFVVRWLTDYHLGRGGLREVVYRFDQQKPVVEDWDYTARNAEPAAATLFLDPSHRFARRLLESGAGRMLFRLRSRDGDIHDLAVPLDDAARALIRPALDKCS